MPKGFTSSAFEDSYVADMPNKAGDDASMGSPVITKDPGATAGELPTVQCSEIPEGGKAPIQTSIAENLTK